MGSARQWLLNMTAGLMPRRLVVNHQQTGLLLEYEYEIRKELFPGIIEPLASRAVWWKTMSEISKIALEDWVWTVSGVCLLKIVPDNSTASIKARVELNAKIASPDRKKNRISLFDKQPFSFSYPELRYLFVEEKAPDQPTEEQNDSPAITPLKFCRPD